MILPRNVELHASTEFDTLRNRVASRLANAALRIASPDYRKFVSVAILYGMRSAASDVLEGDEPPVEWREEWRP